MQEGLKLTGLVRRGLLVKISQLFEVSASYFTSKSECLFPRQLSPLTVAAIAVQSGTKSLSLT
jgi:hypothetical protein